MPGSSIEERAVKIPGSKTLLACFLLASPTLNAFDYAGKWGLSGFGGYNI